MTKHLRVLIALTSCHKHREWQQAQRDTWIKEIPAGVDYRFFLGRPNVLAPEEDEVFLDVPDDYNHLKYKTKALLEWSIEHGYEHTFKTDVDTLVNPTLLLSGDFSKHDYMGGVLNAGDLMFASGGAGYWLTRKAAQCVVEEPATPGPEEDVHVARAVFKNKLFLRPSSHYKFLPGAILDRNTVTYHLSSVPGWKTPYSPEMMYQAYTQAKEINGKG